MRRAAAYLRICNSVKFSTELIKSAGLVGVSDRDGSVYDYFRDRLIFPIEDPRGQVIGFGARALGEAQPKYLNSPESPSFVEKIYSLWMEPGQNRQRGAVYR